MSITSRITNAPFVPLGYAMLAASASSSSSVVVDLGLDDNTDWQELEASASSASSVAADLSCTQALAASAVSASSVVADLSKTQALAASASSASSVVADLTVQAGGGVATNAPTVTVQHSAADVIFAPDIVPLTARTVVDDGDGFATTGVEIDEDGVLVGAASDQGGGVWTLNMGARTAQVADRVYTARRITASGNVDSAGYNCEIANPLTIMGSLAQWLRGDTVSVTGALIDQVTDKSGNARHHTATGTQRPTLVTGGSGINNQPCIQHLGDGDTAGNRDHTDAAWARAAPGTTPLWRWSVLRQDVASAANKIIWGDLTVDTYALRQNNTTGGLVQRNPSNVHLNTALALDTPGVVEEYYGNSLLTDYLRVVSTMVSGSSAGNNSGTAERHGASPTATTYGRFTYADKVTVLGGIPTLTQLSKLSAYALMAYGVSS